jgi:DNA-binding NarL/FixJ family response regulator
VKILLVDDHTLFRAGLRALLATLQPDAIIDEAAGLGAGRFDVVLLDFRLPDRSGLVALAAVRAASPRTPVVILSGEDAPKIVRSVIKAGAVGFVPKSSPKEILRPALELILAGGVYLPPMVLADDGDATALEPEPLRSAEGVLDALTERQREVLRSLLQGKANKVIARDLGIAPSTVKLHLAPVFSVLGARNRTEAMYAAARLGLQPT